MALDLSVAQYTYRREFGFFFFFNIAVAVSSTCRGISILDAHLGCSLLTSFFSAPDASLTPRLEAVRVPHNTDTHFRLTFPLDGALFTKSGSADMLDVVAFCRQAYGRELKRKGLMEKGGEGGVRENRVDGDGGEDGDGEGGMEKKRKESGEGLRINDFELVQIEFKSDVV